VCVCVCVCVEIEIIQITKSCNIQHPTGFTS